MNPRPLIARLGIGIFLLTGVVAFAASRKESPVPVTQPEPIKVVAPVVKRPTADTELQKKAERLLSVNEVPYGAVIVIEPSTGRVLAVAESSKGSPSRKGDYLRAAFPSASIFKLVTGAALLDAGVSPTESVCFHGGKRRLTPALLKEDPKRDRRCATLTEAMGHSTNVVFARLAGKNLDAPGLLDWAHKLGFNRDLPCSRRLERSKAEIPEDELGFAKCAAGFGETTLSPLHGAMLAAAFANGGKLLAPRFYDEEPYQVISELDPGIVARVGEMMETTVEEGTARKAFHKRGKALTDVRVAGKTGTLADRDGAFRDFSWFVGYAPIEAPKIAFAVLVENGEIWRVRAPEVARDVVKAWISP